jgi:NhaP-type Na+/H+ or K+/H+ antiporter
LSGDIIPKACGIIAFGLITRMIIAYVAVGGRKLTKTDRMFVAVAWIPKATVQAALCSVPLAMVEDRMSTYKNYEELNIWAHQIFTTTLIAILITAPLGLISIHLLGPRLLSREELEAETNSPKQKILLNENQSVLNEQKNYADDQPMTTCA